MFGDVSNFLDRQDFQFYDFITEYRYGRKELNRKGQLAFADALFLRTPEFVLANFAKSEKIDKLQKYMATCAVYKKFDLIEVVRDTLDDDSRIIRFCDYLLDVSKS